MKRTTAIGRSDPELAENIVEPESDELQHYFSVNLQAPQESFDWKTLIVAMKERPERHMGFELDRTEPVTLRTEPRIEFVIGRAGRHPGNRVGSRVGRFHF